MNRLKMTCGRCAHNTRPGGITACVLLQHVPSRELQMQPLQRIVRHKDCHDRYTNDKIQISTPFSGASGSRCRCEHRVGTHQRAKQGSSQPVRDKRVSCDAGTCHRLRFISS